MLITARADDLASLLIEPSFTMDANKEYDSVFKQPALDAALTTVRFKDRVVVVTGGASGIGRAIVERFCNDGASVAIFDIDVNMGKQLEEKMGSLGKRAKFHEVDVSNKDRVVEAVRKVADDNGGSIHFLVNCAGDFGCVNKPFLDTSAEKLRRTMDVNVIGPSILLQACFPFMKTAGGGSCAVVNITSVRNHAATLNQSGYSTSKAALQMLTKCMALDLSSHGIRVNCVSPGAVWTPWQIVAGVDGRGGKFETSWGKSCHMTPQTFIEAAGIASVVTFLCSADAMFIDGADIPVDCGFAALGPEGAGRE